MRHPWLQTHTEPCCPEPNLPLGELCALSPGCSTWSLGPLRNPSPPDARHPPLAPLRSFDGDHTPGRVSECLSLITHSFPPLTLHPQTPSTLSPPLVSSPSHCNFSFFSIRVTLLCAAGNGCARYCCFSSQPLIRFLLSLLIESIASAFIISVMCRCWWIIFLTGTCFNDHYLEYFLPLI